MILTISFTIEIEYSRINYFIIFIILYFNVVSLFIYVLIAYIGLEPVSKRYFNNMEQ